MFLHGLGSFYMVWAVFTCFGQKSGTDLGQSRITSRLIVARVICSPKSYYNGDNARLLSSFHHNEYKLDEDNTGWSFEGKACTKKEGISGFIICM